MYLRIRRKYRSRWNRDIESDLHCHAMCYFSKVPLCRRCPLIASGLQAGFYVRPTFDKCVLPALFIRVYPHHGGAQHMGHSGPKAYGKLHFYTDNMILIVKIGFTPLSISSYTRLCIWLEYHGEMTVRIPSSLMEV